MRQYRSPVMSKTLAFIRNNPGCTGAQVNANIRRGKKDKYVYQLIGRLIELRLVSRGLSNNGVGYGLFPMVPFG